MPHTQEIRFAVVLYGGVSLAIYINGVVQELLRLVRSTSGLTPRANTSEEVYRRLGQALDRGPLPQYPAPGDPIRTKFQIDVICGTSAGGLNGIYLAKALVGDRDISSVQDLWFAEGDIGKLLNDKDSYKGLPFAQPNDTESLLNSRRMYYRLLKAFDKMDESGRGSPRDDRRTSPLADEIDVFATTTDINGVPVPIRLLDNIVYERRYRNDFHLRFIADERNDFQADNNPFLAFAARCTSSFPFAFEPMRLCEIDEVLARDPIYSQGREYCRSDSTRWQKFYTNYLDFDPADPDAVMPGAIPFPQRPFGDGGYLNNAPFSYAVDALLSRHSAVPVDRKLIFVEPSPAHPEEKAEPPGKPDAIANSMAALLTIPGYQTIRNDLQRMLERNRHAAKIKKALREVENVSLPEVLLDDAAPPEMEFLPESACRGCYQIRATETVERLALIVARALWIDEDSILFVALRSLIRAWREHRYQVESGNEEGLHGFLRRFDLAYRLRRLRLVLRKLDGLHGLTLDERHPAHEEALAIRKFALGAGDAGRPDQPARDLGPVWSEIGSRYVGLHRLMRRLSEKPLPEDKTTPPAASPEDLAAGDPVAEIRGLLNPMRPAVMAVLAKIAGLDTAATEAQAGTLTTRPLDRSASESRMTELACDREAVVQLEKEPEMRAGLERLDEQLAEIFARQCEATHEGLIPVFAEAGDAARIARRYYACFDIFDCVQFPMSFGTNVGEPDEVDIIRIAPEDAPRLAPDDISARRTKLKGLAAAHFGAFLDGDWRVSDLLWGRLDAAERIITALLPLHESQTLRERLIDEAQAAILEEFGATARLRDMAVRQSVTPRPGNTAVPTPAQLVAIMNPLPIPATLPDLRDFMDVWRTMVPHDPERSGLLKTLARGSEITGRILDGIANKRGLPLWGFWLVTVARALWGLVEISIPRSLGVLLGRYWQSLLLLISLVLIVAGLLGAPGAAVLGAALLAANLIVLALRSALGSFIGGGTLRPLLTLLLLLAVVLLAAGLWQICKWVTAGWAMLGLAS